MNQPLVTGLQQRSRVGRQEGQLDVVAEIFKTGWMTGSIVYQQQDLEGDAFLVAVGFQLAVQLVLVVVTEYFPSHPALLVGVPMDWQESPVISLKHTNYPSIKVWPRSFFLTKKTYKPVACITNVSIFNVTCVHFTNPD